ncbi:MAG: transcription antitermination factor NusB [Burkholderiales bacterium]|nr:transcription antitermination factor NusB [Burkholderiales bacterium]
MTAPQTPDSPAAVAATAPVAKAKPKSARRWAREFALQAAYELFVADHDPGTIRIRTEGDENFKRADKDFFRELWTGLSEGRTQLEALVQTYVDRPFAQISPIERSIILIGAWELQSRFDIPYRVAINESVELAKSFGGTDGHKWVNGVLDKLAPILRADEVAAAPRQRR